MCDSKKGAVRKTFVRNVEIPVPGQTNRKNCTKKPQMKTKWPNMQANDKTTSSGHSLLRPMLNTALKLEKKVTELQKPQKQNAMLLAKNHLANIQQQTIAVAKNKVNISLCLGKLRTVFSPVLSKRPLTRKTFFC